MDLADKFYICMIILCVFAGAYILAHPTQAPKYIEVDQTFQVKEVHLGHSYGNDFITVLYYDNGQIKTVNNENNVNRIDIYITNESESYLELNYIGEEGNNGMFTKNIYSLYITENTSFIGTTTQYDVRSGKSTREVTTTMN